MYKKTIHTTLKMDNRDWLKKESDQTNVCEGAIIDCAIEFYKKNKTILEEYKQARLFIKEIVQGELIDDFEKAKPLLLRLIGEEMTNHDKEGKK